MVSAARAAAFDILLRVEQRQAYADELLHSRRLDSLAPADRALCTEIVMGALRWQSRLDDDIAAHTRIARLDAEVLIALRMAAYQIAFLERIPALAAVNESVELVKRARKRSATALVNAVLRKLAGAAAGRRSLVVGPGETPVPQDAAALAREYAHPAWLVERWAAHFGEEAARAICVHDQQVPPRAIGVAAGVDVQALTAELAGEQVTLAPGALLASSRVVTAGDITHTAAYRSGRIRVLDEASQLVAALVGRGQRLLDCCAAPGGKTAALADRHPGAQIVAADLHPHRARLLRQLVRAPGVRVIAADARALPLACEFDRILADVPCSGTGTLARNPEIKWRLAPADLADLHARQVAIVHGALERLASGGRLVYSTCSLEPEECEAVVEEVLSARQDLRLLPAREEMERLRAAGELAWGDIDALLRGPCLRTLPGVHPGDGFFAAILEKRAAD